MTETTITFRVVGNPVTQGNKTAFVRGGRAVLVEGRGGAVKRHKDWRADVAQEARNWQERHGEPGLLDGPVLVTLRFGLTKPASAPKRTRTWPIKARSGDLDKLARSILDSLTGTIWRDDSQVVGLVATKDWADPPGVEVVIHPAPEASGTSMVSWVGRAEPVLSENAELQRQLSDARHPSTQAPGR